MANTTSNNSLDFDFGFTLVDEGELTVAQDQLDQVVQDQQIQLTQTQQQYQAKIDGLKQALYALLTQLSVSPEKIYILWPDRVTKIAVFKARIDKFLST